MRWAYPVLAAFWIVFAVYWAISAAHAKRNTRTNRTWAVVRAVFVIVCFILFVRVPGFRELVGTAVRNPVLNAAGLVLCALGLGLAMWARVCLGRNWGMPVSIKEQPELVMRGPYHSIRHPIYAGMLLAILAAALVGGVFWLLMFAVWSVYFGFAARAEERLMLRQFPDRYPEYRKRTKALVPFLC